MVISKGDAKNIVALAAPMTQEDQLIARIDALITANRRPDLIIRVPLFRVDDPVVPAVIKKYEAEEWTVDEESIPGSRHKALLLT